jgi:putative ABC transport system substrate-binding protein
MYLGRPNTEIGMGRAADVPTAPFRVKLDHMKRREIISLLVASAVSATFGRAKAQPGAPKRIGCLVTGTPDSHGAFVVELRKGLAAAGYIEGRDLVLELRWSQGDNARLPALAEELAATSPELILAATTQAALQSRPPRRRSRSSA